MQHLLRAGGPIDFDPLHGRSFVRFSYAGATADMQEAVVRIARWLGSNSR